jgi:hypothetical protein
MFDYQLDMFLGGEGVNSIDNISFLFIIILFNDLLKTN